MRHDFGDSTATESLADADRRQLGHAVLWRCAEACARRLACLGISCQGNQRTGVERATEAVDHPLRSLPFFFVCLPLRGCNTEQLLVGCGGYKLDAVGDFPSRRDIAAVDHQRRPVLDIEARGAERRLDIGCDRGDVLEPRLPIARSVGRDERTDIGGRRLRVVVGDGVIQTGVVGVAVEGCQERADPFVVASTRGGHAKVCLDPVQIRSSSHLSPPDREGVCGS